MVVRLTQVVNNFVPKKNFDVPFCKRMGHENGMDRWIDRLTDRQKDMVIPVCPKFCLV